MPHHFDIIVIGAGSMGAATCWQLSKLGVSVLCLEQFDTPNDKASHGGETRIIRKAYFEDPFYVPLLDRAYQLWNELEQESSQQLFYKTGIVYVGKPGTDSLTNIETCAKQFSIDIELPDQQSAQARFPQIKIRGDFKTVFEKEAGFLLPGKCIEAFIKEGTKNGATVHTHETVIDWQPWQHGLQVTTNINRYTCDKLIITAGAWTSKIIKNVGIELKVTEQLLAWVQPLYPEHFRFNEFPCWFIDDPAKGMFYGFPILPSEMGGLKGMKLAHHKQGSVSDPDRRTQHLNPADIKNLHEMLQHYMPDAAGDILFTHYCMYTNSLDEHFIIDFLPGYNDRVIVACGFSGHGFKFATVVGEILAELAAIGKTKHGIDFFRLSRWNN